jgi:hypothetical protein
MRHFVSVGCLLMTVLGTSSLLAQSDPLSTYYEKGAVQIKELKNRSLDTAVPATDREAAAAKLRALYPRETPGLWRAWLGDETAPGLANVAMTDMAGHLFSSHYHPDGAEPDSHVQNESGPDSAREILRSLAVDSDHPSLRKAALDTLGSVGDPVGLAALKNAVKTNSYEVTTALRHLSAAPKVGAPILAEIAADEDLSMNLRVGAVRVMTNNSAYAPGLKALALSSSIPSAVRQEAIRSQFSVAPDAALESAVAAINASKNVAERGSVVDTISVNADKLPATGNTHDVLHQLNKDLLADHGGTRVTHAQLRGLHQAIVSVDSRALAN